ncbi:MAG: polysaccharide deacetylase family protein [Sediminibacterium sp.]
MNILTFDIEEWFHCDFISDKDTWKNYETRIHGGVDVILQHLSDNNLKGTFFILGWIAERYPEVVKKIAKDGHEIAGHSYYHELVHRMKPKEFFEDTDKTLKILQDITGEKVVIYRAPAFSITEETPWAFDVLAELGIEYDCSIFPSAHDYGGFPSFGESKPTLINVNGVLIKEFPMNTVKLFNKAIVFSGGGFFRLFPYWLIKKWTAESSYVMSYIHPRDFDHMQPMLPQLPLMRKFKSYYGLKGSLEKYRKWTRNFETQSLLEASELVDWTNARTIVM